MWYKIKGYDRKSTAYRKLREQMDGENLCEEMTGKWTWNRFFE